MVHDLNNVFQTIGEHAELLQSDPKWRKTAEALRRSVDGGCRVARTILDTQRPSADADLIVSRAVQFATDYLECVRRPALNFTRNAVTLTRASGSPSASRIVPAITPNGINLNWRSLMV